MKRLIFAAIAVDVVMSSICIALWLATGRASFLTGLLCAQAMAIGAFVYFLAHKIHKEWRERMQQFAQQNGMQVIESADDTGRILDKGIVPHLRNLDVFANRQGMVMSPLLQRADNDTELAVFDLLYRPRPNRNHVARTAVALRDPSLQLPVFAMSPKELGKRQSRRLAADSDTTSLEAHVFDSEVQADQLWDHRATQFFREHDDLYVEGGGDVVIVYRKKTEEDGLHDILREAIEVFEMLTSHDVMRLQAV